MERLNFGEIIVSNTDTPIIQEIRRDLRSKMLQQKRFLSFLTPI
ncbi:4831_t:CDS:1, partial [Gigaspora rosea]